MQITGRITRLIGRFSSTSKPPPTPLNGGKACWNCGFKMNQTEIFCPFMKCNKIQPPPDQKKYFDVLFNADKAGPKMLTFDIDEKLLRRRFLELQQRCHPDSFSSTDSEIETEKKLAEQQSSWLNKAYSTLKDPLSRAQYVLDILDSPIEEDSKGSSSDGEMTADDASMLMEIMEIRERISEASNNEEIEDIKSENSNNVHETVQQIEALFPKSKEQSHIDSSKKRTASAKGTSSAAPAQGGSVDQSAEIQRLQQELLKEKREKNMFQIERDKIQEFWDITKQQLVEAKLQLEKKDRDQEKMEEQHREEIKTYKQKVKHLLFEYQTNLTRIEADANKQVELSQDEHKQDELLLKKQLRGLKIELKELEINHQEVIKNLKQSHNEEILKLSKEFDERCKDLFQNYSVRAKNLRDDLDLRRKTEIHEIEERKNSQINMLIKSHEKSFIEMKNYYNDITMNNLALINTLKEQLDELKKSEERNERLMNEICAENKKLKEPLETALTDGEYLRKQLETYEKDKAVLKYTRTRLKQMEEKNKELTWENDLLSQRFDIVAKERDDLARQFQERCKEIEQKVGRKNIVLEQKLNALKSTVETKDTQLWKIANEIAQNPSIIKDKSMFSHLEQKANETIMEKEILIQKLHKELLKAVNAYNAAIRMFEDKIRILKVPNVDLELKPMAIPSFWSVETLNKE